MHLDAPGFLIVNGLMTPALQIKIRTKLAIGAREQVQVELGGHPRAVVIGAFENRFRFFQIDSHEQTAARTNDVGDFFQKIGGVGRLKVSNG